MDTLFSNVTVVTMDEQMRVLLDAFVGVTDGKVSYLSKKAPEEQPQTIVDGTGMVLAGNTRKCAVIKFNICNIRIDTDRTATVFTAVAVKCTIRRSETAGGRGGL